MESRKSAAAQYRDVVVVLEVTKLVNDTSASGYARKKRLRVCGNLITQNERNSGFGCTNKQIRSNCKRATKILGMFSLMTPEAVKLVFHLCRPERRID